MINENIKEHDLFDNNVFKTQSTRNIPDGLVKLLINICWCRSGTLNHRQIQRASAH
jgi:hypothetical protein